MNLLSLARFDVIDDDAADAALVAWGHFLGGCNRPFGRQSFGLYVRDELVSVAVSASTVNGTCGEWPRQKVVELARQASSPTGRAFTRVCVRLWRELAPTCWAAKYWPVEAVVSYHDRNRHATMARIFAGLEKFGGPELSPFLVVLRNNQSAQSIDAPVPTLTTSGANVGVAQPFLMHITHGSDVDRTHSVESPMPTITTAKRGELALAQPFVISAGGANLRQPRSADDPLPTVMGSDRLAVVEPFILQQQSGGVPRATDEPLPTIATDGAISLVQPVILPPLRFNPSRVSSVDEPLPTITATGGRLFGLAEPFLVPFYTERPEERHARSRSVDEPLPTITASGSGKLGVVEPYLTKYNRTARGAYSINEPIDTISTRDRFALVQPVVNGYVLDIHFRMLQPHELAAATSFPKSYEFRGSREDVVKQIGNSWTGELSYQLNLTAVEPYARPRRRREGWRSEATA